MGWRSARNAWRNRLLLQQPSGFDLHSVRDYVEGDSLRKVHWPTTARRGHLMVKELEDSPRDELAVVLDANRVGEPIQADVVFGEDGLARAIRLAPQDTGRFP